MNIVITTIFPPTTGPRQISEKLETHKGALWVVGDRKGPTAYDLPNTRFFDIEAQSRLPFQLAKVLPEKHYARKNLGYLLAVQAGAEFLVETDDDNIPLDGFWKPRRKGIDASRIDSKGWYNVYRRFSTLRIWPRGFPLERLVESFEKVECPLPAVPTECLIQQGLADDNPDVDAVYRLTSVLPVQFRQGQAVSLERGSWCPFNSQNTTFFREAFPLLYLPSFCSFRMTDIWRSFVAQRCLWEMDSTVAFTSATMVQARNDHNLLNDFEQEIPGYLNNERIRGILETTALQPGRESSVVCANLTRCYAGLVEAGLLLAREMELVNAWNHDLASLM